MILTLIQGLIFVLYVTFIILKFGILDSISQSWYKLREMGGLWYLLFTAFCWSLAITMGLQSDLEYSLFIYSGAGLAFVGAATMFNLKNTFVPYVHFIGAATGILLGLIALGVERQSWIPAIAFAGSTLIIKLLKIKHSTWWIEIAAFITIITGLLILN